MLKMVDIRLREQLKFEFECMDDVPSPDLDEFAKQCKIVYLLKTQHHSKGTTVGFSSISISIIAFFNNSNYLVFKTSV